MTDRWQDNLHFAIHTPNSINARVCATVALIV